MDKKMLTSIIFTLLSVIGIVLYQISIQGNPLLVGFGFVLATLSIILAIGVAFVFPN